MPLSVSRRTAPLAKAPLGCGKSTGSSNTKSAPFFSAAAVLVHYRKWQAPPLHKAAAHDDNHAVGIGLSFCSLQHIGMPLMKGVIFGNDTKGFHKKVSFLMFNF